MKRWRLLVTLLVMATVLTAASCTSQTAPTPPSEIAPTSSIVTVVPISTLLPTITLEVRLLPTAQPVTPTAAPTPTVRRASTTRPAANLFPAPAQLEPTAEALFKDGNDIQFVYGSAGRLAPNQCYLLHIDLAVPNLEKGNRGDDFLDTEHCGYPGPVGKELTFVLYRGKFTNSPNYGTILVQVGELAPEARQLKMTWTVRGRAK